MPSQTLSFRPRLGLTKEQVQTALNVALDTTIEEIGRVTESARVSSFSTANVRVFIVHKMYATHSTIVNTLRSLSENGDVIDTSLIAHGNKCLRTKSDAPS